jgi:DNA-directed RNA polymerase subunit RPC12/RpoP
MEQEQLFLSLVKDDPKMDNPIGQFAIKYFTDIKFANKAVGDIIDMEINKLIEGKLPNDKIECPGCSSSIFIKNLEKHKKTKKHIKESFY